MPDSDKLWLQSSLNAVATNEAAAAIQATGRALPCTVTAVNVGGQASLVTVKFEAKVPYMDGGELKTYTLPPLTLPKAESQWLRAPVQVGDVGMTVPADTFLGGVSGLGTGVAELGVSYGNLSTLAWVPIAATSFGPAPDLNKAWINGPNGFVASDTQQTVGVSADHGTGTVTIYAGLETIVITSDPSIVSTVSGAAGALQTIVDGAGNAISHVVPSGGLVGLGAVAASLPATAAAIANSDVSTFENSLHGQRFTDATNVIAALVAAGATGGVPYNTIVAALASFAHIPVPSGSSIVRVAGG